MVKREIRLTKPNEKKEIQKLRSLMFESDGSSSFTPMNVVLFSVLYILSIYFLHIIVKITPAVSPTHVLLSVGVLGLSGVVSFYLYKRK